MVDDVGSHEIRIVTRDAGAAERDHGLRHVKRHKRTLRRLGSHDVGDRHQVRLGRQAAKSLVEQFAERGGIDIADYGDLQRILG